MAKLRTFCPPRQQRRTISRDKTIERIDLAPWANAVINGLKQGNGYLILVNNASSASADFRHVDDQLAKMAILQSVIANETTSGKEINALKDQVGYPPFTFSEVEIFYPGSTIPLAQHWEHDGMSTLIPDLSILPPREGRDDERRPAVLFGVGNITQLENLEKSFLDAFNPSYYNKCFSNSSCLLDGSTYGALFFVQWGLTQEEASKALGVSEDSPEFDAIMEQLERQAYSLQESTDSGFDSVGSSPVNPILKSYKLGA